MTPTLLAKDIDIMISELALKAVQIMTHGFLIVPQHLIDLDGPLTSGKNVQVSNAISRRGF